MKKKFLILLMLISNFSFAQSVKPITNSEITNVKVYLNGARVIRELKTTVESGMTQLSVEGLSAQIDKNSISVTGSGDVVLLSVVYRLNYLGDDKKSPEIRRLEDSLDILKTDLEKTNGLESIFNDETAMLNANRSVGGANTGVDPDNLREVIEFFRNRMIELKMKLIDVHKEQKKLNEKITRLNQQLAELNAKKNQPTSSILVNLSAKQKSSVNLELSYNVSNAGWTPIYDIRAKDIKNPVQLAYKANVVQNTGENWENVKLTLSTGNPSQSGVKPNLVPWYIDFLAPIYKRQMYLQDGKQMNAAPVMQEELMSKGAAATMSTLDQFISVDENQLSTDFEIQLPYSIPSDGKQYAVDIQNYNLPADYRYFAAPKLDKDAFLLARITGWGDLNLLPGKANVYFEGSFIGESVVDPRSTGDTLDLSLGRDKKIIITREKKKDLSSTKFIGGNIVKELSYEITIRNTKKESVQITLEDQIPVSRNSDIKVNLQEYTGGNYNEESGKITWKLNLPPSATEKRTISFSVKYPKDKVVNGL